MFELTPEIFQQIAQYITDGLSPKEACILAGIPREETRKILKIPELANFIEKKKIEFKYNHLQKINRDNSAKTSQWLLEKLRPEQFGSSRKNVGSQHVDIFAAIIKNIQKSSENPIEVLEGKRTYLPDKTFKDEISQLRKRASPN